MGSSDSQLPALLRSVEGIDRSSFPDDGDRIKALLAVYKLMSRLETPWDTMARLVLNEPALGASLKTVQDLQLFEKWRKDGDKAQSSAELGRMVSCDGFLLWRILRHLSANNLLEEVTPDTFRPTAFTKSLLEPEFGAWVSYLYDATLPCYSKLPEYLAQNGYKNPTDPEDGVFQYTKQWKGDLFKYYDSHAEEGKTFNNMMGGVMAHQAGMLDIYPYEQLVGDASASKGTNNEVETALLVDVGGNVGHDMEKFRAKHPEDAARLVLQDRPEVVCNSKCPSPVRVMAHDFFTPQPILGARAYYLHGILHDWSDEPARKILQQLKNAMRAGHSKLLIHDHVLPDSHPHPHATAYDLTMMVKVSAFERSESMWHALLDSVGIRILKIWSSPVATQSVIEAEMA